MEQDQMEKHQMQQHKLEQHKQEQHQLEKHQMQHKLEKKKNKIKKIYNDLWLFMVVKMVLELMKYDENGMNLFFKIYFII